LKTITSLTRSALFMLITTLPISAVVLNYSASQASTGENNATHPSIGVNENGQMMIVWWDEVWNRIYARIFIPEVGYSNTMELPGQVQPSSWPRVKGGADDEFHVVWSSGKVEYDNAIMYCHYRNGSFSPAEIVQQSLGSWPDLCFHLESNTVTVAWEEFILDIPDNGEIMVRQRINGRWAGKVNASDTRYWAGRNRITTDDAGNLYAVWQQKTQIGEVEIYETFYNRTIGGAWQQSMNLSNGNASRVLPNIAVSPDGSEVYVQWFNLSDHFHWGRAIAYLGNTPQYGDIHRIAQGSYDHMHYYTGMAYHQNVLYMTFVDNTSKIWLKNYLGTDSWGEGGTLPSVRCPRTPDLSQSPNLGLALAWYNRCASPNTVTMAFGEGFGDDPDPPKPKPNDPPIARITVNPPYGIFPLTTTISGLSSSDADGQIVSYMWTLGDGSSHEGGQFQHSYQAPGEYTISLTVTDNQGSTSYASAGVTVWGMEPPINLVSQYRQNRNLFSVEHYYQTHWENNPINEQRGFKVVCYNVFRRLKGQSEYQHVDSMVHKNRNEYLDRSLKNNFYNYEYAVSCVDLEGRQSGLAGQNAQNMTPGLPASPRKPKPAAASDCRTKCPPSPPGLSDKSCSLCSPARSARIDIAANSPGSGADRPVQAHQVGPPRPGIHRVKPGRVRTRCSENNPCGRNSG